MNHPSCYHNMESVKSFRCRQVYPSVRPDPAEVDVLVKRRWHWWVIVLVGLALAGTGWWFLGRPAATEPALTADGLHILMFLDTWGRVSGPDYAFPYIRVEEDPNVYDVEGGLSFYCQKFMRPPADKVLAEGAAHKASGKVYELSVYGEPVGRVTEDKLRFLQPFYDALIAVFDPSLSLEDRAGVLQTLKLRPADLEVLKALTGENRPRLTLNGIEYSVSWWGSEEGGTVELQARILEASGGP